MTYLGFHLIFLIPPIAAMILLYQHPRDLENEPRSVLTIPAVCVLALSYTTPWDNYLVAQDIWWYGPERVLATIGFVPVEEYLFFLLQPLLTGLVVYQYLGRFGVEFRPTSSKAPWIGSLIFVLLTSLGATLLLVAPPKTLYVSLILLWAPPILAGMWLYDGETLWALRRPVFLTTAVPTVYLWGADAIAIEMNIWTIAPQYTLGISPFGLPIEEATFFLLTNLLVVTGILLLLYGSHRAIKPSNSIPTIQEQSK